MNFVIKSNVSTIVNKQIESLRSKYAEKVDVEVIKHDMEDVSLAFILEEASTVPMFSDYKIIVCDNAHFLTSSGIKNSEFENNYDDLIDYLNNSSNFCSLVFVVKDDFDRRKKVVKEIEKLCKIFNLDDFSEEKVIKLTIDLFQKEEKTITYDTAFYLCSRLNFHLPLIFNEISKLCLISESEITIDKINLLVSRSIEDNIFELSEKIINANVVDSYNIYNDLLMQKEEPIAMLAMVANQFRLILQVKGYIESGYSQKEVASLLKVHPYRIKLAANFANNFSYNKIEKYLRRLCEVDYFIKIGKVSKNEAFELFILSLNAKHSELG